MYIHHDDRRRSLTLVLHLSEVVKVQRITKYCALLFYEDRFLSVLESLTEQEARLTLKTEHLDLYPMSLGNMQLLAIVSFWIATKLHETQYSTAEELKKVATSYITERHVKSKDILETEVIILQAIKFDVSCGPSIFSCFEKLLLKFRKTSIVGELVSLEACENLLDLVYDLPADYIDILRFSKPLVASAILAVGYLLCVPDHMADLPLITHDMDLIQWLTTVANVHGRQVEFLIRAILLDVLGYQLEVPAIPEITEKPCVDDVDEEFRFEIYDFDSEG